MLNVKLWTEFRKSEVCKLETLRLGWEPGLEYEVAQESQFSQLGNLKLYYASSDNLHNATCSVRVCIRSVLNSNESITCKMSNQYRSECWKESNSPPKPLKILWGLTWKKKTVVFQKANHQYAWHRLAAIQAEQRLRIEQISLWIMFFIAFQHRKYVPVYRWAILKPSLVPPLSIRIKHNVEPNTTSFDARSP